MGKFIDETGNRYNRLTVIERAPTPKDKYGGWWRCKCDCGNEVVVFGTLLRNNNTKSCGCLQKDFARSTVIDETGNTYGFLTVIKRAPTPEGKKTAFWYCKCVCGNEKIVEGINLREGHTRSCGQCHSIESVNKINELGNRYGHLLVIEEAGRKDGKVEWLCRCDCGNLKITTGKSLRADLVQSCGCLHSLGEQKISQLLTELNIDFVSQKIFDDCRNPATDYHLYFDFYLPQLNIVIEYQGQQHYMNTPRGRYTEKKLQQLKERDKIKRKYCKEKNIKYVEIPYTDFDKINKEYIQEVIL